jgi:hypothetical protein
MRTVDFWRETLERAVKSSAQALIGLWPLDQFNVLEADFPLAAGIAGGAALLSTLTSIASSRVGDSDSPAALP